MACPHVAGLAALLFTQHPAWTNNQVRSAIENSCDSIDAENPDYIGKLGGGRINAYAALNYTPDAIPPSDAPSTPSAGSSESTSTEITFTWTQGTAADPESGIKSYYLQVGTAPGGNDKYAGSVGNSLTKIVTGCVDQQTYYARVRAKNGSNLYAAWVDKVEILPPDSTPPDPANDLSISSTTAYSATLKFTSTGDDGKTGKASFYDIRYAKTEITESTWENATVFENQVTPLAPGHLEYITVYGLDPATKYYFAVKICDGANYSGLSNIASATTNNGISLAEALDNSSLTWTSGGNAGWIGENTVYYSDNDAAQSGPIANDQSSYLQALIEGPAAFSFYWKVSSEENYDYLKFYIDDQLQDKISGEVAWEQKSFSVTSGKHTLKWIYSKDSWVSNGSDAGWVDKITFADSTPPLPIATVNDGLDADIQDCTDGLAANWTASSDNESGIAKYWYAIGTAPGATDILNWTSNGLKLSIFKTSLPLTSGRTYYFSVKAENGAGLFSTPTNSNGQRFTDNVPPTGTIRLSPSSPLKTGDFDITLTINDASLIPRAPTLSFTLSDGKIVSVPLTGSDKDWSAASYIESSMAEGSATFSFSAEDSAGNKGTYIASGTSFIVDTTIDISTGGYVSNGDHTTVYIPAAAYSENVDMQINIPDLGNARIKEAVDRLLADKDLKTLDPPSLLREITARGDVSGPAINTFNRDLTITIPYPDVDQDGLLDGTDTAETSLKIFYYDELNKKWKALPQSTVNTAANSVTVQTAHLSLFAVMAVDEAGSFADVITYPNPCYLKNDGYVRIAKIPLSSQNVEIYIYNLAGELVRTLTEGDEISTLSFSKAAQWEGKNEDGEKVAIFW